MKYIYNIVLKSTGQTKEVGLARANESNWKYNALFLRQFI